MHAAQPESLHEEEEVFWISTLLLVIYRILGILVIATGRIILNVTFAPSYPSGGLQ